MAWRAAFGIRAGCQNRGGQGLIPVLPVQVDQQLAEGRLLHYNCRLHGNSSLEINEEVHMYAVIKTGGKQYRVASGEKIKVEQIAADVGQEIVFDQVLAVGSGAELKVGTPLVSGATVSVTVLAHGKHDKVSIFKMRRRKHYQKRQGHRQQFTELLVGAISA
jgi:large subunit ribosomal protein L21